jgi:hypothetical protein
MRQDLTEIPARREGQREPHNEGDDDFEAHLFSVTPIPWCGGMSVRRIPTVWCGERTEILQLLCT